MSLLELRILAIGLIVAALGIAGWQLVSAERKIGAQQCQADIVQERSAAQIQAMKTQADTAARISDVYAQSQVLQDKLAADRDAALAKLRNRPPSRPNLPASAAAACAGATGADLSEPSARAFTTIGFDADALRIEYDKLYDVASKMTCQPTGH